MKYLKYFLLLIICFNITNCEYYYTSGENPFTYDDAICSSDTHNYDKTFLPPESFGVIGVVSNTNEYPRANINNIDTHIGDWSSILDIGISYKSLCKTSKIDKIAMLISNQEDYNQMYYLDAEVLYDGKLDIDIDPMEDDRCLYLENNNKYIFNLWARDKSKNTYFASTYSQALNIKYKSIVLSKNIKAHSSRLKIKYTIKSNTYPKRIYVMIDDGYGAIEELKGFTKSSSSGTVYINYLDHFVFKSTGTYKIALKVKEVLPECEKIIVTTSSFKNTYITLAPIVKGLKISKIFKESDTPNMPLEVTGYKYEAKVYANYSSKISDYILTINDKAYKIDFKPSRPYTFTFKQTIEGITPRSVSFYVINKNFVKSNTVHWTKY